ncbi:MAG: DUF6029 family protein [Bacteroidota bacterium]
MTQVKLILTLLFLGMGVFTISAQDLSKGTLTGSFQSDFQYYIDDSVSNKFDAVPPEERIGTNTYLNLNYQIGDFRFGVRYEAYFPSLLGYPSEFDGSGIANRFAQYRRGNLEVTAGNFYEQFGSGMLLRAYEQRQLGLDNSIDGARVKYYFDNKAKVTGLIGKQRDGFSDNDDSRGTVRAFDVEVYLDQTLGWEGNTALTVGGSYVGKYQRFAGSTGVPPLVDAFGARFDLLKGGFMLNGEYVRKGPDPGALNGGFVNPNLEDGDGVLINTGYSQKGLAVLLGFKRVNNFDFRSNRSALDNRLQINYVPANTTQHTYRLLTLYPYATQVLGEFAFQGDFVYTIPKKSKVGGKYGTTLTANYAIAKSVDAEDSWKVGDRTYFQDINFELSRKWSKKVKTIFKYAYIEYDATTIEGRPIGLVFSNTFIADVLYKINRKNSLRVELQHLATKNDRGSWAFALIEYGRSPNWFFFISDELNYGEVNKDKPIHYYNVGAAYSKGANRVSLSWGRQRFGLVCVGGVCRIVPEYSGLSLSVTSSF